MESSRKKQWWSRSALFWIAFVAYLALQTLVMKVLGTTDLASHWRLLLGLLPVVPLLAFALGLLRIMREEDELYKRIQFEAIAYAAGTVMVLGFTLGFLEQVNLIPHINATWAAQVLIIVWAIAGHVLTRRFG